MITEGKNAGVTAHPIGIIKTPDRYNYPPDVPYVEFEITGYIVIIFRQQFT